MGMVVIQTEDIEPGEPGRRDEAWGWKAIVWKSDEFYLSSSKYEKEKKKDKFKWSMKTIYMKSKVSFKKLADNKMSFLEK